MYPEERCCTLCHASSFLRALILEEAPGRQKLQSMRPYTVPPAEAEFQGREGFVERDSADTAPARPESSKCNRRNGFNLLTQVHCGFQNILMKSISQ